VTDDAEPPPIEGYWSWVAVALFLLITVDLLTSMYAAAVVDIDSEFNPVMQWLLGQPAVVIAAVNIGVVALAGLFFYGLRELLRYAPAPQRRVLAVVVELWLGLLVAAGLFVFVNNLAVIVLGESLL